jgi:general secretion pathway protein G
VVEQLGWRRDFSNLAARFSAGLVFLCEVSKMSFLRSAIGLTALALVALMAQSQDQTRAKEASLRKSLFILRKSIDQYTFDQHKAPQALQDLIAKGYVGSIPTDPMTGSNSTWRVAMEDPAKSTDRNEPGIFDVHSGSDHASSDGTRYADW